MKLTDLFPLNHIRQGIACASKKRAFELIGEILCNEFTDETASETDTQAQENPCTECLFAREKIGNSALGGGVAMPKGRVEVGDKPLGAILQLNQGIDYDADDNREVDLIFSLIIPASLCEDCSALLPKLIALFSDKAFIKQIRAATSAEEIFAVLQTQDNALDEPQTASQTEPQNEPQSAPQGE